MEKIIAFDFDGTLCTDAFPDIGLPNYPMLRLVTQASALGYKTILWTCRVEDRLEEALRWCRGHGIYFDAINNNVPENIAQYGSNSRKVFADIYVDDKSFSDCEKVIARMLEIKEEQNAKR